MGRGKLCLFISFNDVLDQLCNVSNILPWCNGNRRYRGREYSEEGSRQALYSISGHLETENKKTRKILIILSFFVKIELPF